MMNNAPQHLSGWLKTNGRRVTQGHDHTHVNLTIVYKDYILKIGLNALNLSLSVNPLMSIDII